MSKLVWDQIGEHLYETGVDRGVLYPVGENGTYPKGVAWSGLTGVNENPSGGEANAIYADNRKYLSLMSAEELGVSINAYTYPEEFAACDGTAEIAKGIMMGQQTRKAFGLSYRTIIGNDTEFEDHGYKLHLIYGAKASPSSKEYKTVNDSPEAIEFSWEATTTPVEIQAIDPGTGKPFKPSASLTIDSTKVDAAKLAEFEKILYGTDGTKEGETTTGGTDARLPLPDEVIAFFNEEG